MSTKSHHARATDGDGVRAVADFEPDPLRGAAQKPIEGLSRVWEYEKERLSPSCYVRRWRALRNAAAMPQSLVLKPAEAKPEWILYFVYAPAGRLDGGHLFTLDALKASGLPVLAVVATDVPRSVPEAIVQSCDAVIWKALSGYDFSAYAIGLEAIADRSPGADVLVFNDSMFGPFHDLRPFLSGAPWDLTGFMATDGSRQRHIQSYAFVMKDVRRERLRDMGDVFTTEFAFDDARSTICSRELWMARRASDTMSVGSYWFGAVRDVLDPTLSKAIELVDAGFPFMKRSLLTKQSHYQRTEDVVSCLGRQGHPVAEFMEQMQIHARREAAGARGSLMRRAGRKLLRGIKRLAG